MGGELRCAVVVALLAVVRGESVVEPGVIGNPRHTTGDVRTFALAQSGTADDSDVSATDGMTDDELVESKFASIPQAVNMENLKAFINPRGVANVGLINDLIARSACILRLEADIGAVISTATLGPYLKSKSKEPSGSRDDMFDEACDYQKKEIAVRQHLGMPIQEIDVDEIKAALAKLGFMTTQGNKEELVYRLGKAHIDVETIRHVTGDSDFDTSDVHDMLGSRSLAQEGSASEKLDRLASYLVSVNAVGQANVHPQCDMVFASSLCVDGGKKVYAPKAVPRGMVVQLTFDDKLMLDHSGKGHHANGALPGVGPGVFNSGFSAKFDGTNQLEIPHSDHLDTTDFCMTFWIYLEADSNGQWRSIVHKGNHDHERTPSLFLEPQARGLELFVETDDVNSPSGERLWSNTFLPLRKWTHVGACCEGRNMRMYINGMLDAENTTIGNVVLNKGPIFVGNDPWRPSGGTVSHIDEFRFYNRMLQADEIQAQAATALGGVEPTFVELGCMACSLDNCPKSCRRGYRVCTQRDLASGGYQVARSQGWANSETRLWANEDLAEAVDTPDSAGLCLCCRAED